MDKPALRTGPFQGGGFYADCDVADRCGPTEREAVESLVAHLTDEVERLRAALEWLGDWADTDPDAPGILSASEVAVKALKVETEDS